MSGQGFDLPQAEQGFIGALLVRPNLTGETSALVQPDDILAPALKNIYVAMLALWGRGIEPTGETIKDELRAHNLLERVGGESALVHLMTDVSAASPAKYIPSILEHSLRRRLIVRCRQAQEIASDPNVSAVDALDQAKDLFATVDVPGQTTDESVDVGTFVAGDDSYDWLIPSLLERGERVLVVAGEKAGKSMVLRQMAVTCAYGIHPFRMRGIDPMKVLLLDLENPPNLIRRKVRPMLTQAQTQRPQGDPTMMRVLCRPGGINLAKRSDSRWLEAHLSTIRPDLVVAGPLYKMFSASDDKWESGASAVASQLDDLRTRMGFALILETHAPQGYGGQRNLRPIGSSIWLRWPEFIVTFAALEKFPHTVKVTTLVGRDERTWPTFLERGGLWPWTPCRDPDAPTGAPEPPRENTGPNFSQSEAF